MADLIERLERESYTFNFFQALSLLEEKFLKESGIRDPVEAGVVRMSSDSSTVFPSSDIAAIRREGAVVHLVLTFMGFTGVASPLPLFFSEYVRLYEETAGALRDFLSIFNNRMYALFYRGWKKYHFMRNFAADGSDVFTRKVASLAGFSAEDLRNPDTLRKLAYTGVLAGMNRNASGLRTILSDFFDGIPVTIQQFYPRWAEVTNPPRIGSDSQLGVNALCGTRVWDIAGKFRVTVGPLKRKPFETFLPGTDNVSKMKEIIRTYLVDPLDHDIEVQLESIELIPVVLGKNDARLGETSSLGKSDQRAGVQSIVIAC